MPRKKKIWAAKLDTVVFADGGNVVDCFKLAGRVALWDIKVPHTKQAEHWAHHRHSMQGDVGMDVGVDKGVEGRGGLEAKGLNGADFELTDYWDEGEAVGGRESGCSRLVRECGGENREEWI